MEFWVTMLTFRQLIFAALILLNLILWILPEFPKISFIKYCLWRLAKTNSINFAEFPFSKTSSATFSENFQDFYIRFERTDTPNWNAKLQSTVTVFKVGLSRLRKIFAKLTFPPALFEKIPSFFCLVFKTENKWMLKLLNLFC